MCYIIKKKYVVRKKIVIHDPRPSIDSLKLSFAAEKVDLAYRVFSARPHRLSFGWPAKNVQMFLDCYWPLNLETYLKSQRGKTLAWRKRVRQGRALALHGQQEERHYYARRMVQQQTIQSSPLGYVYAKACRCGARKRRWTWASFSHLIQSRFSVASEFQKERVLPFFSIFFFSFLNRVSSLFHNQQQVEDETKRRGLVAPQETRQKTLGRYRVTHFFLSP